MKKSGPGREVDPPTGAGRMKLHADCWQTTSNTTHAIMYAIDVPTSNQASRPQIQPFLPVAGVFAGFYCAKRTKNKHRTVVAPFFLGDVE